MRMLVLVSLMAVCLGCEGEAEKARQAAQSAQDRAKAAARTAKQASEAAADKTKAAAKGVAGKTTELRDEAVEVLAPHAKKLKGGIESIILDTTHKATQAARMGTILASAVDRDSTIVPIWQDIGDAARQAEVDTAIRGMPRTEVVDGVTVGFKDMVDLDGTQHTSDTGYLVVWRRDDKLIGFVYRSKMKIDFARLTDLVRQLNREL